MFYKVAEYAGYFKVKIFQIGPPKGSRIAKIQIFQPLRHPHSPIVFHYTSCNPTFVRFNMLPSPQHKTTLLKNPICLPFINALHVNLVASQKHFYPLHSQCWSLLSQQTVKLVPTHDSFMICNLVHQQMVWDPLLATAVIQEMLFLCVSDIFIFWKQIPAGKVVVLPHKNLSYTHLTALSMCYLKSSF